MQKTKLNILSTRPLNPDIIKKAEIQNIFIDCISFIETEAIKTVEVKERIQKLAATENINAVFTSMNAVAVVKQYLSSAPGWNIFSTGQTTRELISDFFGERNIIATANDAGHLADEIIKKNTKEVVFFCGDQRRDELPEKLKAKNVKVHEIIVYRTNATAKPISKNYDAILFFSPSAVESFFSANYINNNLIFFAIGNTTANTIRQKTNNKIIISKQPGKEALVRKMITYFNKEKQVN
jgi:uroporphyrinogen-III synthase